MDKRKLLLSAVFAAGIMGTSAVAGDMQVLNEDDLEEVSAQGFQTIDNDTRDFGGANNQNNNLDSVQMNDNAQQNAKGADLVATSSSSLNLGINIMWSDSSPSEPSSPVETPPEWMGAPKPVGPNDPQAFSNMYEQKNDQVAKNHVNLADYDDAEEFTGTAKNEDKQSQSVINNVTLVGGVSGVDGQNNNNNSVQLNDYAQQNAKGLEIENTVQSAGNVGINIFASGDVDLTSGSQLNKQKAYNMENEAEGVNTYAYNAESGATQQIDNGIDGGVVPHVENQNNNNNSVQLNDYAQQNAEGLRVSNNSNSGFNTGMNIHYSSGTISGSSVSQENDQLARNHMNTADGDDEARAYNKNKETQDINNTSPQNNGEGSVADQNNNNNSVQLNNFAQQNARGLEIKNSAMSAYNTGMNIMAFDKAEADTSLTQKNKQTAQNMGNTADGQVAYAGNYEDGDVTQDINNDYDITNQNNNNNSVQANGNAQSNAAGLSIANTSNSAHNVGVNIMVDAPVADKGIFSTSVLQKNKQVAENHKNVATAEVDDGTATAENKGKQTQNVVNADIPSYNDQPTIDGQNNNNNSVQLNDYAQQNATGLEITNSAVSAVNTGINIGAFNEVNMSDITQKNRQTASNFENSADAYSGGTSATAQNIEPAENPGQYVHTVHSIVEDQDNNNNSVQLNDFAQQNAEGLSIANVAKVALNSGINILWFEGTVTDSTVLQKNNQTAGNHNNFATSSGTSLAMNVNKQTQLIENCYCADVNSQNNNQNSVQANDFAQQNVRGWHVVNGASSAVNMGTNIMVMRADVSGTSVRQVNVQRATNFSNIASGRNATAGNVR